MAESTRKDSLLQQSKTLLLVLLLVCIEAPAALASRSSMAGSVTESQEKSTTATNRGPRGSAPPRQSRHRLQAVMPYVGSYGYGGVGGLGMSSAAVPAMMDQIVPVSPTVAPAPTPEPVVATYLPGALTVQEGSLILSQGLTSRVFAISGEPVRYADGTTSSIDFHIWPDGAATFADTRPDNPGGWIYVSNLEARPGGVGAITFNSDGNAVDYKMLTESTIYNCNGGKTPWETWITAEEDFDNGEGRAWQLDPYGIRAPEPINMGNAGGSYEAFAYDVRNRDTPRFFLTEDWVFGALERFTPNNPNWNDPWTILTGAGVNEWLMLTPNPNNSSMGTYTWTTDLRAARTNAGEYYPESEGIDVTGSDLFFVCKGIRMLFTLDLDSNTYTRQSTSSGLFEGEPDMIRKVLSDEKGGESMLYFTEDNGRRAGVHARNGKGELMTILEGFFEPETTGLAMSPNKRFLYVCFQEDGYCFEISRTDGLPFNARTINAKTHPTELENRKRESRKAYRERRFV